MKGVMLNVLQAHISREMFASLVALAKIVVPAQQVSPQSV